MSLKTKRRFKNIGKITASAVFALLFFLNIKIMLNDDISSGDLSLFGVEINLFDEIYATEGQSTGTCCPQQRSTCVIGNYVKDDAYYKSEGPCP